MEYGLIFHVTHIGKYYCKNMKYRIIVSIILLTKNDLWRLNKDEERGELVMPFGGKWSEFLD